MCVSSELKSDLRAALTYRLNELAEKPDPRPAVESVCRGELG